MNSKLPVLFAALAAVAATGVAPAAAEAVAAPGPSCLAGDSWLDYAYVVDPSGGATASGYVCKDHVTTGDYWAVEVDDTAADGKCAHASAVWQPGDGLATVDYGMYVCGFGAAATFHTPVRNWTGFTWTELGAFVDAGASNASPPYYF